MPILFEARHLCKSFGSPPHPVLKDLSFQIQEGEFIAITGRSGSGKSTLLYVLSSLDPVTSGEITLSGTPITAMDPKKLHQFRNENMGFIFQSHYLLPELTALENVLMPTLKTKQQKIKNHFAIQLLNQFGLGDKLNRLPSQLSGGEQQRVAIARALVMNPKVIFADEPTGNLDTTNGDLVMDILEKINRESGTTIILVTHDPDYAMRAQRSIHLVDGQIKAP